MAKEKVLKNALSICLGIVLRQARERKGWDYEDLSKLTGIRSSYIQSFENANATYHISKALPLFEAYNKESATKEYSIEGIITILSLISILETNGNEAIDQYIKIVKERGQEVNIMHQNVSYARALTETATALSNSSLKYRDLFNVFLLHHIFEIRSTETLVNLIERRGLYSEVHKFIADYDNYGLKFRERNIGLLEKYLIDVPSFYLNFVNDVKNNVLSLPKTVSISEIKNWESKNHKRVETLYVLMDLEDIGKGKDQKDLQFSEEVLWSSPYFNVFCGLFKSSILPDFSILNKKAYDIMEDRGMSVTIPDTLRGKYENILVSNSKKNTIFWLYIMADGFPIAFTASLTKNKNILEFIGHMAQTISIGETLEKLPAIAEMMGNDAKKWPPRPIKIN